MVSICKQERSMLSILYFTFELSTWLKSAVKSKKSGRSRGHKGLNRDNNVLQASK